LVRTAAAYLIQTKISDSQISVNRQLTHSLVTVAFTTITAITDINADFPRSSSSLDLTPEGTMPPAVICLLAFAHVVPMHWGI